MIERILIIGTGLIGASISLALREAGYKGRIHGFDADLNGLESLVNERVIDDFTWGIEPTLELARNVDVVVLAVPVLAVLDWMQRLAPVLGPRQFVTDVGSTKQSIADAALALFNKPSAARFLPGHPMAGKEQGGWEFAEASLFQNAMWLFTPVATSTPIEQEWRDWVAKFGCRTMDMDAARHDELCAWVSHLPQMLSTALAALLEDKFGDAPEIAAIGGRALRETTRLGASPYSMWRDVAMTNTEPIADTLLALEQRLQHVRENLRTPELRDEFALANKFRARRS
jgi:prephenate dehydrogenase